MASQVVNAWVQIIPGKKKYGDIPLRIGNLTQKEPVHSSMPSGAIAVKLRVEINDEIFSAFAPVATINLDTEEMQEAMESLTELQAGVSELGMRGRRSLLAKP
jgi:hypothetical protein